LWGRIAGEARQGQVAVVPEAMHRRALAHGRFDVQVLTPGEFVARHLTK